KICGVFGRAAEAAPPQDRLLLDDVVEPGPSDHRRRERGGITVVLERAEEGKRAGDVVVRKHDRQGEIVVYEGVDLAEAVANALVTPALDRPAVIDAENLAENAGVDLLFDAPVHRLPRHCRHE